MFVKLYESKLSKQHACMIQINDINQVHDLPCFVLTEPDSEVNK